MIRQEVRKDACHTLQLSTLHRSKLTVTPTIILYPRLQKPDLRQKNLNSLVIIYINSHTPSVQGTTEKILNEIGVKVAMIQPPLYHWPKPSLTAHPKILHLPMKRPESQCIHYYCHSFFHFFYVVKLLNNLQCLFENFKNRK